MLLTRKVNNTNSHPILQVPEAPKSERIDLEFFYKYPKHRKVTERVTAQKRCENVLKVNTALHVWASCAQMFVVYIQLLIFDDSLPARPTHTTHFGISLTIDATHFALFPILELFYK